MKLNHLTTIARKGRTILAASVAMLTVHALPAADFFNNTISGVTLGNASGGNGTGQRAWAILALGGTVNIGGYDGATGYTQSDANPEVVGNVGVYNTGTGGLSMSGYSEIKNGSIYFYKSTQVLNVSTGKYNGTFNNGGSGDSYMSTAATQATAAQTTAGALANSAGTGATALTFGGLLSSYTSTNLPTSINLSTVGVASITGAANTTYVLNLATLAISAATTLTLSGSSTTNFIFNISSMLALSNNAKILLGGTLQPQNILYNVKSGATAGFSSLTPLTGSTLNGIILAPTQTISFNGGVTVRGEVIAKSVTLSSGSRVINPVVSP